MDGTALQQVARARAEELPAAKMTLPFGPDYGVAKVLGKMFLLLTEVKGTPVAVVKAELGDPGGLDGGGGRVGDPVAEQQERPHRSPSRSSQNVG